MNKMIIDFSAGVVNPDKYREHGFIGAARYVSPARDGWMVGKPMKKEEADLLKKNGLEIVSIFQNLKEDWRRGSGGGHADAHSAMSFHKLAGGPSQSVIYCAIDSNPSLNEWNEIAVNYLRAFKKVLEENGYILGIYCNTKCHAWAVEDGIDHFWWAHGWGSDHTTNEAHIHQFEIDSYTIDGIGVDRNRVQKEDFGQWSLAGKRNSGGNVNPGGGKMEKLFNFDWETIEGENLSHRLSTGNYTRGRGGKSITGVVRHHTAGSGQETGESLLGFWNSSTNTSTHYLASNGRIWQLVNDSDTAHAVGSTFGNQTTLSIEHASGTPSQDYPISDETLKSGAYLTAALLLYYNLGYPKFGANIFDHKKFSSTSCPYHLAEGGKYHAKWMKYCEDFYNKMKNNNEGDLTVSQYNDLVTRIEKLDKSVGLILDQLVGHEKNPQGAPLFKGWSQTGGRTITNAIGAIGEALDIDGMLDMSSKKKEEKNDD